MKKFDFFAKITEENRLSIIKSGYLPEEGIKDDHYYICSSLGGVSTRITLNNIEAMGVKHISVDVSDISAKEEKKYRNMQTTQYTLESLKREVKSNNI